MRDTLRVFVTVAIILAIVLAAIYTVPILINRSSGDVIISLADGDLYQSFGNDLLTLSGGMLSCIRSNGGVRWQFTLGENAGFFAGSSNIVAWNGDRLYIINASGTPVFDDRMPNPVRFARIGATYAAVVLQTEAGSVIRVLNASGVFVYDIDEYAGLNVVDCGFFDTDGVRLWTNAYDLNGNAPSSTLNTFDPRSRAITGSVNISGFVYNIYTSNKRLMLATSSKLMTFDYKCVEVGSGVVTYGSQVLHTREVQGGAVALFVPNPDSNGEFRTRVLRLIGTDDRQLRLPAECTGALLGSAGVYAFRNNYVYYAKYGSNTVSTKQLNMNVVQVLCILSRDVALLRTDIGVCLVQMPGVR